MKKRYWFYIAAMLLLFCVPVQAAAKTPGTTKLKKISAPAYNKVKITWKKAANAAGYREDGTKKWTKIATVKATKTSYTHKSSTKYPIVPGQKYNYTVRAC